MEGIIADFSAPAPGIRIKRRWNGSAKVLIGAASTCVLVAFIILIVTIATLRVVPFTPWSKEIDDDSPVIGKNGACSSGNTYANAAAVEVLKEGGNAVDAAIAAALVLGVRNPFASGIGGGGVMLIHMANGTDFTIDCRETAPNTSYKNIYVDNPMGSQRGGLSIGVPGELKCMATAWRSYGSLSMGTGRVQWSRLFREAISTARNGFPASSLLVSRFNESVILSDPGLRSVFAPNGTLLKEGEMVYNTKLADTLSILAGPLGADALYNNGPLTSSVLSEINGFGGQFTSDDITSYNVILNGTYQTTYDDFRIVGAPLPFAGSLMMMQTLNVLESFELGTSEGYDAESLHYIIEASKFAFGNRLLLGDPRFSPTMYQTVEKMLSKTYAQTLASKIDPTSTRQQLDYVTLAGDEPIRNDLIWPPSDHGTTHISVVDVNRMAISFTTSINWGWGSGCMGAETGILYNNELDDFSLPSSQATGWPNNPSNFPGPGKRPLSSMTPTFVFDKNNKLVFVAGGAGGTRIFSGTLQTFLYIFEFGYSVKTSSKLPRLHNQLNPDELWYESFMLQEMVDSLAHLHHNVRPKQTPFNYINTIQIKWSEDGNSTLEADSDWRKDAVSKAYKRNDAWDI